MTGSGALPNSSCGYSFNVVPGADTAAGYPACITVDVVTAAGERARKNVPVHIVGPDEPPPDMPLALGGRRCPPVRRASANRRRWTLAGQRPGLVECQVIVPLIAPERRRSAVNPDATNHVGVDYVALRSDGSLKGFAMTIPHRMLGVGDRLVRVRVRDAAARTLERRFSVSVSESDETSASTQLRQPVCPREVDILCAGLPPERRPAFTLLIRCTAADDAARKRRDRTLLSLLNQAYGDWRARVSPELRG